jgi:hypothetical protein
VRCEAPTANGACKRHLALLSARARGGPEKPDVSAEEDNDTVPAKQARAEVRDPLSAHPLLRSALA